MTVISVLLIALMLAACGNTAAPPQDTGTTDPGTDTPGTPDPGTGTPSTPDSGANAGPERSRTVNFAYGARPQSLNPSDYLQNADQIAFQMYYETLIYTPHDGSGYQPMLAESWEIDPGQMFWTFHLRQGVTFHNGEPFDADDVVATFQHLIDIKDESDLYIIYWPDTLQSVEKIDQYTVKVNFSKPYLTAGNGFRCTYIFPNEAYEELGDELFRDTHSYGTGAWVMEEWLDGQYTRFTKNENYWNKENYDSYFTEVYYRHLNEAASTVAAHLAGDISVNAPLSGVDTDVLPMYENASDRIEIITVPTHANDFMFFQFNETSPCHDINFRRAVNHAIDRQGIYDTIYAGNGEGATDIWHKTMQGYNADNAQYYTYDVEKAKEYLAQTDYAGEEIRMICQTIGKAPMVLQAIAGMLEAVGINAVAQPEDQATFRTRRLESDYDLSWGATNMPDRIPGRHLNALMTNTDKHNLPEDSPFYELVRTFNAELDPANFDRLLRDIGSFSAPNLAPHMVIGHPIANFASDYGITGVDFYVDGFTNFARIDYDPALAR